MADTLNLSNLKISEDIQSETSSPKNILSIENEVVAIKIASNNEKGQPMITLISKTPSKEVDKCKFTFDEYFKTYYDPSSLNELGTEADKVTMKEKMKEAEPYNIFYNTLKMAPETEKQINSISFTDLLCPSFGKLKSSLHITFMCEIQWLLEQYAKRNLHNTKITILYGFEGIPWPERNTMEQLYPNIDYHLIDIKTDLGCHHTKLAVLLYEDGSLRVVISSVNLYSEDWELYNQQLWVSPACPPLPKGSSVFDGESPTGFKIALLDYLNTYNDRNISNFRYWMDAIKNADFSDVKVVLIYSSPGIHFPRKNGTHLHYLGHILSRDCTIPAPKEEHDSWRVVVQTASLGLIGHNPDEWLTSHVLKSLESNKNSPYLPTFSIISKIKFSLIYPTLKNSLDGYLGPKSADCCVLEKSVRDCQPWLNEYMCQWKADKAGRTRAIAHSKCYLRISPCWQKMAYYLLTSANFSRSAWGRIPQEDASVHQRSFELGVLFLPKYFGEEYFEVMDTPNRKNRKIFPIMFDLPLKPYGPNDEPFCTEVLVERELIHPEEEQFPTSVHSYKVKKSDLKKSGEEVLDARFGLSLVPSRKGKNNKSKSEVASNQNVFQRNSSNLFFPDFTKR